MLLKLKANKAVLIAWQKLTDDAIKEENSDEITEKRRYFKYEPANSSCCFVHLLNAVFPVTQLVKSNSLVFRSFVHCSPDNKNKNDLE